MYIRNIILKIQDCVLQCGSKVLLKLCLILIWVSFFGVRFEVGGNYSPPPRPLRMAAGLLVQSGDLGRRDRHGVDPAEQLAGR